MSFLTRLWILCHFVYFLVAPLAPSWASEPLELVRSVSERVIEVLMDPTLRGGERHAERRERVRAIVNPVFDYEEMARRTLSHHWRRRSESEQQEFVKLLRGFLEKIYSDRLALYAGERLQLGRESLDRELAEVEAQLVAAKGAGSTLVFRLKRGEAGWKFYDAVVEDISIIDNYRAQFDRVIAKSSFNGLLKMLRDRGA